MKKSAFVNLTVGTVGGLIFALGMRVCLLPEWNAFQLGVAMCLILVWQKLLLGIVIGVVGIILLLMLIPMCLGLK